MSNGHAYSYPPTGYGEDHAGEHAEDHAEPVRRSAPASVHLVAMIGYLAGLALIAAGVGAWVFSLGGGQSLDPGRYGQLVGELRRLGLPGGALLAFAGLLVMAVSRKVQRGRQWVRLLVVVLSALSIAGTLYDGLVGPGTTNVLLGLVLPVIYVVLLNTSAARSWFRRRTY
jgi:hypothetical protein